MRQETVTEYLNYTFSEAELKEFSRALARESTNLSEFKAAKATATAQFAERIKHAEMEIAMLSRRINTGSEYRNVECEVLYNAPGRGFKTVVRRDTGELVNQSEMTENERQESLQFDPQPAPASPDAKAKAAGTDF